MQWPVKGDGLSDLAWVKHSTVSSPVAEMSNVIVVSSHSAGPPSTQRQTTWLSGVVESTSTTMRRSGPPKRNSIPTAGPAGHP